MNIRARVISAPNNAVGSAAQAFLAAGTIPQVDAGGAGPSDGRHQAVRPQVEPHAAEAIPQHPPPGHQEQVLCFEERRKAAGRGQEDGANRELTRLPAVRKAIPSEKATGTVRFVNE